MSACDGTLSGGQGEPAGSSSAYLPTRSSSTATPQGPVLELSLDTEGLAVAPQPLRAGFPFTVTATIHNDSGLTAAEVPVMVHISALREGIGYAPFLEVLTVTVPASQSLTVDVPVHWNFDGGEHLLWVQVNRLPEAWQDRQQLQAEGAIADNIALMDLMIDPFDAYTSDLCSGRIDVEIGPADVLPEPDKQQVRVTVHNPGNSAVYNLPVVVLGRNASGIVYTPAIPPCGGTAQVVVPMDRPFGEGVSLDVLVNPSDWEGGLVEDNFDNNQVAVTGGIEPGTVASGAGGLQDYDFAITSQEIEIPQQWVVLVKIHNLGTRDAAMVPIRIENDRGRKILDAIPLVRGNGLGIAAFPVGYLWVRGGTLTFTVNPPDATGALPETNRDNNVATFTLP
ncbi:MAG: hypothetical protein M8467_18850 [Anaerolineae bacterium]|nr:hypothetical protein [Anaerolineae bacterium]